MINNEQLKKILFVINPKAGVKARINIAESINKWLDGKALAEFLYWENASFDISKAVTEKIKKENFDAVVAVGGDGTVNNVARALINTNIPFGILPLGSGNGLARHLKISMNLQKAINVIIDGNAKLIDYCTINNVQFFCTSGVGFDAHIGQLFANSIKRGFKTYTKIVFSEFKKYKAEKYKIIADGKEINTEAFLITIANANQYGNNAFISPLSNISDGLMDVVILKPFNLIYSPLIVSRLFLKKMHNSKFVQTFKAKNVIIYRNEQKPIHFDGEPYIMGKELIFKIFRNSLKAIIQKKYVFL